VAIMSPARRTPNPDAASIFVVRSIACLQEITEAEIQCSSRDFTDDGCNCRGREACEVSRAGSVWVLGEQSFPEAHVLPLVSDSSL
jgi:hypothetical protein